jgi:HEAT repeat protein
MERVHRYERERNVAGLIRELSNPLERGRLCIAAQAARALGHLGDHRAVPYLQEAVTGGSERVRINAVRALAEVATQAATPTLTAALSDESRLVRMEAAAALARSDAHSAAEELRRVADGDADPWVRLYAGEALFDLGDSAVQGLARRELLSTRGFGRGARARRRRWRRIGDSNRS